MSSAASLTSTTSMPLRYVLMVFAGMSRTTARWLHLFRGTASKEVVYVFDPATNAVCSPGFSFVPAGAAKKCELLSFPKSKNSCPGFASRSQIHPVMVSDSSPDTASPGMETYVSLSPERARTLPKRLSGMNLKSVPRVMAWRLLRDQSLSFPLNW